MPLLFLPINFLGHSVVGDGPCLASTFPVPPFLLKPFILFCLFLFLFSFFFLSPPSPIWFPFFILLPILRLEDAIEINRKQPPAHDTSSRMYSCTSYLGTRCPAQNQQLKLHMNSPTFEPNHPDFTLQVLTGPAFRKVGPASRTTYPKKINDTFANTSKF